LQVRWQLDHALAQGCTWVTVNVADLTFIDAAGLAAFVHLRNTITQRMGTVTFVATSPSFRRICALTGLTKTFGLSELAEPVVYDMA
jgi:anti-anti-sigma factor